MKKVVITKENTDSSRYNKRIVWICGDYACITRFEHIEGLPLCDIRAKNQIVVDKSSDWENAHPYDLFFESIDNGLCNHFKNLGKFEEFALRRSSKHS